MHAATAIGLLRPTFPKIAFSVGTNPYQLIAVATPEEHEQIKKAVQRLTEASDKAAADKQTTVYKLSNGSNAATFQVLNATFPGLLIVRGPQPDEITIQATPKQHEQVKQIIDTLAGDKDGSLKLVVYNLGNATGYQVIAMVRQAHPSVTLTVGPQPNQLSVLASEEEHVKIKEILDKLSADGAENSKMIVYETGQSPGAVVLQAIRQAFPYTKVTNGPKPDQVSVWATEEEHAKVKPIVDALAGNKDAELKMVIYNLGNASGYPILAMVRQAHPSVTLTVGPQPNQLSVLANEEEHAKIKVMLDTLSTNAADNSKMVVYETGQSPGAVVLQAIRQAFPYIKITNGPNPDQVSVLATEEEHAKVKPIVDAMAGNKDAGLKMVIYDLGNAVGSQVLYLVRQAHPTIKLLAGPNTNQLSVLANEEEHAKIKEMLDTLATNAVDNSKMVVYETGQSPGAVVLQAIRQAFPYIKVTNGPKPDQVSVWATEEEHAKVKPIVDAMAGNQNAEQKMVIYNLGNATGYQVLAMVRQAHPSVTLTVGPQPNQLSVLASEEEHAKIKEILDTLSADAVENSKMVVYETGQSPGATVLQAIRQAFPYIKVTNGPKPDQVSVWASEEEHAKVKPIVDAMAGDKDAGLKMVIYNLGNATGYQVLAMVRQAYPSVTLTVGPQPNQLSVLASEGEHTKIKAMLDTLANDATDNAKMVVYDTGELPSHTLIGAVRQILPYVKIIAGPKTNEVSIWANDEEHKMLKQMIDTMVGGEDAQAKMTLYETKRLTYQVAVGALRAKFPTLRVTPGLNANQMAIWASPAEHEQIKTILDTLDASESPETSPTAIVYPLETIQAAPAISVLRSAFPQVAMSQGSDPYKLIAVARPEDHELLKKAIEQMIQAPSGEEQVKPVVYPLSSRINQQLVTVLRQTFNRASFAIGSNQRSLIAWARVADQKKIEEMVRQLDSPEPLENVPKAQVFKLKQTAARSVIQVLSPMYADATFSAGQTPTELIVMARPEDMKRIETAIIGMTTTDDPEDKTTMQAHSVDSADSAKLFQMLQAFYNTRPDVQVSLDARNNTIVAIARPQDHAQIDEMIHQIEAGATPEAIRTVKSYSVENVDTNSLLAVLNTLLESQRQTVSLSVDPQSQRLLAIARQKQHDVIAKAIEDMRGEARTLEILNFEEVNPETAMLAIQKNFVGQDGLPAADAPTVDLDEQSDQLFVRGTAKQHKEIRELLGRMGETSMVGPEASNTRIVPFSQDVESILKQVQEVWSKTEQNPIKIGSPSAEKDAAKKETEAPKPDVTRIWGAKFLTVSLADTEKKEGVKKEDTPAENPQPEKKPSEQEEVAPDKASAPQPTAEEAANTEAKPPTPVKEQAAASPAPVYLIPGDKSITVKSDDPEALARMEKLLRSMSSVKSIGGKDFQVFMLKYTDAEQLVPKLEDMAFQMAGPNWWESKHAVIMSDRRLNAVIVQGSRKDREMIGQLIEFLDTNDFPKELPFNEPTILPIANTDATEIEDIIYGVFSDRLARRGRGGYGSWWNTNTAKVVAEETSNSLVIIAQEPLRTQIIDMAKKLDVAATAETANTVKLIQLKNLNASAARQLLNATQSRTRRPRAQR